MRGHLRDHLERVDLRELGLSLLFAAVVLFVAAMAMLGRNVAAMQESYASVQRSNTALLKIEEINTQVMGIDMTIRGYALTDDPVFLMYFSDSRRRLHRALDVLDSLIRSEPEGPADMADLRRRSALQEQVFAVLARLGPGHAREIAAAITDPVQRRKRYEVQRKLTALHDKEEALLVERQAAALHQASRTYALVASIGGLAFVVGAIGFALTLMGRRQGVRHTGWASAPH
ncbi:MAG: CHASE3 domain-containing protein [Alphaproteobacteria bacterium]|nr:CHASE3 domain-containing protein [Alphaproteobacteria bacterium]